AIVQGCDTDRLLIDHRIQGLDVQARCARDWCFSKRLSRESPELPLQFVTVRDCLACLVGRRYGLRETDTGVCVADEKPERSRSDRFWQGLCAQVGRADVICVVHNCRTTGLITSDREGEAERKDERYEPEQRTL